MVIDKWGRYVAANDKLCRMSGYSEEELLSMTVADLTVAPKVEQELWVLLRKMDGFSGITQATGGMRRKDGTIILCQSHARAITNHCYLVCIQEIKAGRQAGSATVVPTG